MLSALHKLPQAPQRLQWALLRQDEFKGLIKKLIGYNDAIEGLFEALLHAQRQTYMSILQLSSKVDNLKEVSHVMQVQTQSPSRATIGGADGARITEERQTDNQYLASFKAQQSIIE